MDKEKISAVLSRKDVTGEEMNMLLEEELDACVPPPPEFDKFVRQDGEEEDMDEDEEESEDSDEDEEMGEAPSREIEEANKGIQRWFTEFVRPDPWPGLRYLFERLDQEKIKTISNRKDITGEEKNKLLEEEVKRCAPPYGNYDKFVIVNKEKENMHKDEEDKGMDDVEEDGEMTKALGDEEKPGFMKRPQSSLAESESELKKSRVTEGLGCQREEPEAAEM